MQVTKRQYNIALLLWTIIVLVLLLMPASSFSAAQHFINIPHADKIAHSGLFGVLSFLLYKNLGFSKGKFRPNIYVFTTFIIFFFGLLTEILQGLMYDTAKRRFSWADLLFDTLACIMVMVCCFFYYNKRKQQPVGLRK